MTGFYDNQERGLSLANAALMSAEALHFRNAERSLELGERFQNVAITETFFDIYN